MQAQFQMHEDVNSFKKLITIMRSSCEELHKDIRFPQKVSTLNEIYQAYMQATITKTLKAECPESAGLSDFQLHQILDQYILSEVRQKNYAELDEKLCKQMKLFLTKLNFFCSLDEGEITQFIAENIEHHDEILISILEDNPEILSKQYKLLRLITFNKDKAEPDQLNIENLCYKIQTIYVILNIYQQSIFSKYEMNDLYYSRHIDMRLRIMQFIFKEAKNKYPNIMGKLDKALKSSYSNCLKEFDDLKKVNFESFQEQREFLSVKKVIHSYKTTLRYLRDTFKERVEKELNITLKEVILFQYDYRFIQKIKNDMIHEQLNDELLMDFNTLTGTWDQEINGLMMSYHQKTKIKSLFDGTILCKNNADPTNLVTLFNIILLSDWNTSALTFEMYEKYFKLMDNFFIKYCLALNENFPELSYHYSLINTFDKYKDNFHTRKDIFAKQAEKWKKDVNLSINLYAMMSVFLHFIGDDDDSSTLHYNATIRLLIKQIFRGLHDGGYRFTNFQLLCIFEKYHCHLFTDSVNEQSKESEIASLKTRNKIRETQIDSIHEHKEHSDQLNPIKSWVSSYIKTPQKFFLEKISSNNIKSRSIVITVAGFTSEDFSKADLYKGICDHFPNSEVLSLNWASNTMNSIYKVCVKEAKTLVAANSGYLLGWEFGATYRLLTLALTGASSYVTLKKDVWNDTFKESVITGIYLAHIIADTDLFKNYSVSLAGFSLGTMVIVNCLWELQRMKKYDLIYDCLLLGGVVDIGDFKKETLKVVVNNLMNTYSRQDLILRMLLKVVDFGVQPIGISQVNSTDTKVKNLDASEIVGGHLEYKENMKKILNRLDFNEDREHLLEEEQ